MSGFKNLPSKRFHDFFEKKLAKGELDLKEIASKLDKYKTNPGVLLRSLKTGKNSVTVDLILLAQKYFGLNPCDLFRPATTYNVEENLSLPVLNDPIPGYVDVLKSQIEVIKSQQETIKLLVSNGGNASGRSAASV